MPKLKPISFEPELNQRPKDSQHIIYSPPLYQLSYRRIGRHKNTQRNLESLTSWVFEGNQAAFCGKCIKASTQEAPTFLLIPRGAKVARLTPDQKAACLNHVGVRWSLIGVKCLIWTVSFYLAIRSPKKMETWMPKLKPTSFEPELNQRPKDSQHIIYSPPLYQLSYRRIGVHQNNKKFRKPDLLGFLREIRLRFVVNASEPLHRTHHLSFLDLVAQR